MKSFVLILGLFLGLSLISAYAHAQTPPCASAADEFNSYETCSSGSCERFMCNGTSYKKIKRWSNNGVDQFVALEPNSSAPFTCDSDVYGEIAMNDVDDSSALQVPLLCVCTFHGWRQVGSQVACVWNY